MMDVIKECLKKRHSETGEGPMEPRPPVTVPLLPPRGKHRHCNSNVDGGLTSLMDWWDGGASCSTAHKTCNSYGRWGLLPDMDQSQCSPMMAPPPPTHSIITKSGPRKASACWPRLPAGGGHWTRCWNGRAECWLAMRASSEEGQGTSPGSNLPYPRTMPSSLTWTLVWPFRYSASILLLK